MKKGYGTTETGKRFESILNKIKQKRNNSGLEFVQYY